MLVGTPAAIIGMLEHAVTPLAVRAISTRLALQSFVNRIQVISRVSVSTCIPAPATPLDIGDAKLETITLAIAFAAGPVISTSASAAG
mmetsp:Transcript_60375/g.141302  ORF Transcript_60375/g.141302 Transcript_60375/m.141302 type:complete len:88 (-) Transcript_60375:762-1025(-)